MPDRRLTVLVVVVVLIAAAGLLWRSTSLRGSAPDGALVRTLRALGGESEQPILFVSEDDRVDRFMRAVVSAEDGPPLHIIPRDPDAIQDAEGKGILLTGQRGREYVELLGYQPAWLPRDPESPSFRFARVVRRLRCALVRGDAWSPLPGLEYTGRLGIVLPAASRGVIQLVIGDDLPLDVDVSGADGADVRLTRETLPSAAAAPPDYWIEGRSPHDAPRQIQHFSLAANPWRAGVFSMRLGRRAPRVLARLRDYPDGTRATVCAAPISPNIAFEAGSGTIEAGAIGRGFVVLIDDEAHFGAGWSDVLLEPGVAPVRWMGAHGVVLIPVARRGTMRLTLRAYRAPDSGDGDVRLRVNDVRESGSLPLRTGMRTYDWLVPENAWVEGTNEILLLASGPGADRLLAFERMQISLLPP